MVKGICVNCGKHVGGFMQPIGLACHTEGCQNRGRCFCSNCVPKHKGLISTSAVCAQCGRMMKQ